MLAQRETPKIANLAKDRKPVAGHTASSKTIRSWTVTPIRPSQAALCAVQGSLDKAIDASQPGNVLVVDRNDRLARDMLINLTIRHQVACQRATIEYADGSPVDTTPEGELLSLRWV